VSGRGKQRPSLTIQETRLGSRKGGNWAGRAMASCPSTARFRKRTGAKGAWPKQVLPALASSKSQLTLASAAKHRQLLIGRARELLVASFGATLVRRDWCRIDYVDRNAKCQLVRICVGYMDCLLLSRRATCKVGIARLAPSPTVSLVFEYMVLIGPTAN
jgi:hypothetical protein